MRFTGQPGRHVVPRISASRSGGIRETVPRNLAGSGDGLGEGAALGEVLGVVLPSGVEAGDELASLAVPALVAPAEPHAASDPTRTSAVSGPAPCRAARITAGTVPRSP